MTEKCIQYNRLTIGMYLYTGTVIANINLTRFSKRKI